MPNIYQQKKKALLNFIRFTRKMATVKFAKVGPIPAQKRTLREKLETHKPLVYENWLLEKLEGL